MQSMTGAVDWDQNRERYWNKSKPKTAELAIVWTFPPQKLDHNEMIENLSNASRVTS